jgi:hypothetical protein
MKLHEEFKLYETMWESIDTTATVSVGNKPNRKALLEAQKATTSDFDETAFKACLNRVTANAAKYSEPDIDGDSASITVKLSEEDLKKALRIGSRGGYTDGTGVTMPAQLVDLVSLEITRTDDDGICAVDVEIYGENEETGESTHDYNNDDVPFVGGKIIPGNPIESDDEFIGYVMENIVPNAEKLAHEIIEDTWNKLGINDYAGITDYNSKGTSESEWDSLLAYADLLLKKLITRSGNRNYDDGDGYWQSEYDIWCFRYLYYKDTLENTTQLDKLCKQLDKLCNEYSKKLLNVEFYWIEDEGISEIGYIATRYE